MLISTNWCLEDILTLNLLKIFNYNDLIEKINGSESFAQLAKQEARAKNSKFSQTDLFGSSFTAARAEAARQIEAAAARNCSIITYWDAKYPALLRQITYPPTILYVWGELQDEKSYAISIVGTRKCTYYGKLSAERFSNVFSSNGIIICSGLAQGIDTTCHIATVDARGITYAVIASGLDCISPYYSQKLAEKIVGAGGAIISEYKFGTVARPGYFPQRNRIISGISKATVIIEAAARSGALITANFAFDQQREVFALPGNINSEKSYGTNKLIKENKAAIAISPEQVLAELDLGNGLDEVLNQTPQRTFASAEDEAVFNAIGSEPKQIDQISVDTGLEIPELLVVLLNLEFDGAIRQLPGKHYIKSF